MQNNHCVITAAIWAKLQSLSCLRQSQNSSNINTFVPVLNLETLFCKNCHKSTHHGENYTGRFVKVFTDMYVLTMLDAWRTLWEWKRNRNTLKLLVTRRDTDKYNSLWYVNNICWETVTYAGCWGLLQHLKSIYSVCSFFHNP